MQIRALFLFLIKDIFSIKMREGTPFTPKKKPFKDILESYANVRCIFTIQYFTQATQSHNLE